jgi:hypothetical protein
MIDKQRLKVKQAIQGNTGLQEAVSGTGRVMKVLFTITYRVAMYAPP